MIFSQKKCCIYFSFTVYFILGSIEVKDDSYQRNSPGISEPNATPDTIKETKEAGIDKALEPNDEKIEEISSQVSSQTKNPDVLESNFEENKEISNQDSPQNDIPEVIKTNEEASKKISNQNASIEDLSKYKIFQFLKKPEPQQLFNCHSCQKKFTNPLQAKNCFEEHLCSEKNHQSTSKTEKKDSSQAFSFSNISKDSSESNKNELNAHSYYSNSH